MINLKSIIKTTHCLILLLLLMSRLINAQTLTVSLGDNNHAASYEDVAGSDVVMMQLKLSADADIELAATGLAWSSLYTHGLSCISTERIFRSFPFILIREKEQGIVLLAAIPAQSLYDHRQKISKR